LHNHPSALIVDYTSRYGDKIVPEAACRGINAMLAHNQLAFTAQPVPTLSRVDLASLFLHRASFQDANILFGKSWRWCMCTSFLVPRVRV
jgi:hypothetical protein